MNIEDVTLTEQDMLELQKAIEVIEKRSAEIKERSNAISNKCSVRKVLTPTQDIMRVLNAKQYPISASKVKKNNLLTKYIVYAAKHKDEIVYIGSGVNGREKHCISGCSHVYELNKLHFKKADISIHVLDRFMTKEESLVAEKELISEYKPKYNVRDHPYSNWMFQFEVISKWEKYFKVVDSENYKSNVDLLKELLGSFSFIELISDKGVANTNIRLNQQPEIKTSYTRTMLSCLKSTTSKNKKLKHSSELFCTTDGRIKLPIEPPNIKKETI
jgi:hypothetical protein